MKRRIAIITGVVLFLSLVLFAWQGLAAFEALGALAFGWYTYSVRVLPRVTISWDGAATGLFCLVLFLIGLHRTLRWFSREVQQARGPTGEGHRPWSVRWTASLATLIVLMFVVGISATGVVHQAAWLIGSRRSLVEVLRDNLGSSVDHLRWIGMGSVPLAEDLQSPRSGEPRRNGAGLHSWMTESLPFMGFMLGGSLHHDLPWNDSRNSAYFKGVVPIFFNPGVRVFRSPEGYALSHYAGNIHLLGRDRASRRIGPEGASNTILAGEVAEGFKPWGDPTNLRDPGLGVNQVPGGFGGPSGTGANLLFVDGSVRFFRDSTTRSVLRRLSRPAVQ